MSTAIICVILILAVVIGVKSFGKRMTSGCCGSQGGAAPKKMKVKDRDLSHYPHHVILKVDGMICGSCAVRVQNGLNREDGVYARVSLENGEADVYMKNRYDDEYLKNIVKESGYTVYGIRRG